MSTRSERGEPRSRGRRAGPRPRWVVTALAAALVLFVMVLPGRVGSVGFLTLPVEAIVAVLLVLVVPARWRRFAAVPVGVLLALTTLVKLLDLGFAAVLSRPFDPFYDWPLLGSAREFLAGSIGAGGATVAVLVTGLVVVALPPLLVGAALRLSRVVVTRRSVAWRSVAVLGAVWVLVAVTGVQLVPGTPLAGRTTVDVVAGHVSRARAADADRALFARQSAVDAYAQVPGDRLLTGLRGKDVLVVFVESYGRDAVDDPELAPEVTATLDAGSARLAAAGYASRSAYLTTPTTGGASWLAHATLQSGLRVDSERRYRDLLRSDRLTLAGAFGRAGWRTVSVMPATTRDWPEGAVYGYDRVIDVRHLGYAGPRYGFGRVPDQYTLAAFQRLERTAPPAGRAPVLAEIDLVTSHAPWRPVPPVVDWDSIGDGSAYPAPVDGSGAAPQSVYRRDVAEVRADYRRSVAYSVESVVSYVEHHGGDDLVVLMLGDHQPAPLVTGADAPAEVPVTLIAHDPAVLRRIAGWGWSPGLRPSPGAPVGPMEGFRDGWLAAFGPAPA